MLIKGEKYACEACVRGHRVSNCQHSDRPLQHINKKGRPVSQCTHCRAMRKSRSAHVKCDCGIKPNKCVHLQPKLDGHTHTCCCNHGGTCTCACSSDTSTSHHTADGDEEHSIKRSKSGAQARRSSGMHSPPRSAVSKTVQPHKSTLRSRNPSTHTRAGSLSGRRRSVGVSHTLPANYDDGSSGDSTPENVTESGSPPPSGLGSLPGQNLSLDMSRMATLPQYLYGTGYDPLNIGAGFTDNDGPLYSAGLGTPSNMWGSGDVLMTPNYNSVSRSQVQMFDFATAPDQYSEQSSDRIPNLAVASSGEVSEADDNHSPGALDAGDFYQDRGDYEGVGPQPEIFDDNVYYTFDDELQALGYSGGGHPAEKRSETNYWTPASP